MATTVKLRAVIESDLPIFFAQQLDPEANRMAAFTSRDPADHAAFLAHWAKIRADPSIVNQTILADEQVAGSIASFVMFGEREIGYWLGREYWGQGIATRGLALFVEQLHERPLFARVAKDNLGSLRVLQKCGFVIIGEDKGFAGARNAETEEFVLRLDD